jgi:predicted transposase/invertase (TIGR01784 family)
MSNIRINPKVDFIFRKLFGSDENKDLLISLINSIVEPELRLTDVVIKNPFNLASYERLKESILDIKAVDQNGIWYDIEMQVYAHILYGRRAIYYVSKVFTDQLEKGEDFSKLNTTIGIHLLDFEFFNDNRLVHQFVFKDVETNEISKELSCLRLYFVEMSKFDKEWPEIRTALDRWVAFLNRAGELTINELPKPLQEEPAIIKAIAQLERVGYTPEERAIYEGEEKALMVGKIEIETALIKGREEGMQAGMQEGMQEGLHDLLRYQMSCRMGDIPLNIASDIKRLKHNELRELGLAVFHFKDYADVEAWLATKH